MNECTCWHKYPNENMKREKGWRCVDDMVCVRDLKTHNDHGRATKTKCIRKDLYVEKSEQEEVR